MSVLAIFLPARERFSARAATTAAQGTAASLDLPAEWSYVLSSDGFSVLQSATTGLLFMPRADEVVLVMAESDVSWHRIDVPRAPLSKLRAALLGTMEEKLLEEDESVHLALAEGPEAAVGGKLGWVAVTNKPRLVAALTALESVGLLVDRVVASAAPLPTMPVARTARAPGASGFASTLFASTMFADPVARGHFFVQDDAPDAVPWLSLVQREGVVCVRLAGALARALQPQDDNVRWTATPAAAAAGERWLGAPVGLMTEAERMLEALQGSTNLRQFDLTPQRRGLRALAQLGKRFLSPEWRPVRIGLAALVAVQLIGLNAYAWRQQSVLDGKRTAMREVLRTAHPGVRAVLDAPLQMERETERLRAAAGRPGEADLEALMAAAAAAWPDGQGPVQGLRFDGGRLSLAAPGFGEPQLRQLQERLRGSRLNVEMVDGRIVIGRAAPLARGAL